MYFVAVKPEAPPFFPLKHSKYSSVQQDVKTALTALLGDDSGGQHAAVAFGYCCAEMHTAAWIFPGGCFSQLYNYTNNKSVA